MKLKDVAKLTCLCIYMCIYILCLRIFKSRASSLWHICSVMSHIQSCWCPLIFFFVWGPQILCQEGQITCSCKRCVCRYMQQRMHLHVKTMCVQKIQIPRKTIGDKFTYVSRKTSSLYLEGRLTRIHTDLENVLFFHELIISVQSLNVWLDIPTTTQFSECPVFF